MAFIVSIREKYRKMGIPEKIEELDEKDFPEIIKRALHESNPMYPVPVIWGKKEMEKVLKNLK